MDRRQFLAQSRRTALAMAGGTVLLSNPKSVPAAPANNKVVLAIVGCHGRGKMIAQGFARRDDCEMAYICDVDTGLFESRAKWLASCQDGKKPECVQDFRKMLDDKSVDAVLIATPPHWHSLATIWCCQAGKDVYVEKPQSHNCWEGRKAVEAARKYHRVVQVGMQNRSAPYLLAAKQYIEEGKLGKIHLCRVFNQKGEPNFPVEPDADPPAGFDWDMWNGPAPEHRYNPTLRRNWRHLWRYCGGDMLPYWPQNTERVELYGTEGMMVVGRMGAGWQVFIRTKDRKPVVRDEMYGRFPDPDHQDNFIQCIRSRNRPNADVEQGHLSTLLVHYAMISCRIGGEKLAIDSATEAITNNAQAMEFFKRQGRAPWLVPEEV